MARIDAIEQAIAAAPGVLLLHRTSDPDHHRTVITFAGSRNSVIEAAVRAAGKAAELIDLNQHRGVHPRIGALDVLPFVPLDGATLELCRDISLEAAARIWQELRIPVYFYQASATRPDRVQLEDVRRGQFESLREAVFTDESKQPDVGGPALHPTAGAIIAGARKLLIAYNINLNSTDLDLAKSIAKRIRARSGGFAGVKALGLPLATRGLVQVSMNLTDFEKTPPHVVYAEVYRLAAAHGVEIAESELIGLMPRRAIEMAAADLLKMSNLRSQSILETCIQSLLSQPRSVS